MQWTQEMRVRNGNPLQYSCLGNPMDREAQRATVHESDATHTHTLGGWAGRWCTHAHTHTHLAGGQRGGMSRGGECIFRIDEM